ncbi:3-oxoacyl-[acyl-carrier protein] reductase [Halogranum amylolyticum]|uniref:3-oxoacyl-[acyl-carrier protein] reductase n=1 Tax=Halogranum amylolyticum TaxID=660520 RepID=A0A1H8N1R3_9EURY|nr:beta-ketoacyl-ACP reductase [Halogranum amylolyticum]SEO23456.1 3-oxoacyl-[acyl-carrier protein] reductase [Halogranum amylolyticum]
MSQNRTCVITGASRGIGRGIAEELGRENDTNVVVNYRSSEAEAYDVVDAIEDAGGTAIAVQADVCDRDEVDAMAERVREVFGGTDVLVNNAGITVDKTFKNMTRDDWDKVMNVNLGGVFNASKAFYDDIKAAEHGRLVNISSVVGQQGNYGQANYATTKSGLFGFTRTLALELSNSGSTVNCVAPGFTETDMLAEVSPEIQEKIQERIPLNRFATVEDISGVVRFLASEESSYMTGQILGVNGGMEW